MDLGDKRFAVDVSAPYRTPKGMRADCLACNAVVRARAERKEQHHA